MNYILESEVLPRAGARPHGVRRLMRLALAWVTRLRYATESDGLAVSVRREEFYFALAVSTAAMTSVGTDAAYELLRASRNADAVRCEPPRRLRQLPDRLERALLRRIAVVAARHNRAVTTRWLQQRICRRAMPRFTQRLIARQAHVVPPPCGVVHHVA